MGQVGIPLFYLQELSGARVQFKDLFNDEDIYWAWRVHGTGTGRSVQETGGLLTCAITSPNNGQWNTIGNTAPKVIIDPVAMPVEVTVKLSAAVIGDYTQAGLIFSDSPVGFGDNVWFGIVRRKIAGGSPFDGIAVVNSDETVDFTLANTSLPVWFKLKLGTRSYKAAKITFLYSYDGVNFTQAFSSAFGEYSNMIGGICLAAMNNVKEISTYNGISASFDYFIMKPRSIN